MKEILLFHPTQKEKLRSNKTVFNFQNEIKNRLVPHYGTATAYNYAWWIIEFACANSRAYLIANDIFITETIIQRVHFILRELLDHNKPLAYILENVPFAGLSFLVRPPILIPRHETEEWVLELCKIFHSYYNEPFRILDLCTGSGCIAITLAKQFPYAVFDAIDINNNALALAQENARVHNISSIHFIQSNLFEKLDPRFPYDLIVANPPYASEQEWSRLDRSVTAWEDKNAIVAPDSGLSIISKIIEDAPLFLKKNSILKKDNKPQLFLEIDASQDKSVLQLMNLYGFNGQIQKDANMSNRIVMGYIKNKYVY